MKEKLTINLLKNSLMKTKNNRFKSIIKIKIESLLNTFTYKILMF